MESTMFQLGVLVPHSDGQGIGLHVCHRLLHQQASAIFIARDRPAQRGCTAVDLPGLQSSMCRFGVRQACDDPIT
jgi:hypothetical protein